MQPPIQSASRATCGSSWGSSWSACALACALSLGLPSLTLAQTKASPNEPVTLNFVGADIEAVARTMATLTGRNVVGTRA